MYRLSARLVGEGIHRIPAPPFLKPLRLCKIFAKIACPPIGSLFFQLSDFENGFPCTAANKQPSPKMCYGIRKHNVKNPPVQYERADFSVF